MIRAIIIDDEPNLREINRSLLLENFPDIEVVGMAGSVLEGVELIKLHDPQLVLLDIELKDGTGFQILQKVKPYKFAVIFITAHNDFAIKAIKFSALDYIMKPVNEFEFRDAIERALATIENSKLEQQVNNFFDIYERKTQNRKLVLKTAEALNVIEVCDIIYCRSDNSYTTFYLKDGTKIMTSKGMKDYEDLLNEFGFFRPHHSFLVNMQYVNKLDKTDGGFLILKDKTEIPVSSRRKAKLIQILENF